MVPSWCRTPQRQHAIVHSLRWSFLCRCTCKSTIRATVTAPKIFNTLADVIEWILMQKGIDWVYRYLDDFLEISALTSDLCARQLQTLLLVFDEVSIPVASSNSDFLGYWTRNTSAHFEASSKQVDKTKTPNQLLDQEERRYQERS